MSEPVLFRDSIYYEILKPDMLKETHFLEDAKVHFENAISFWKTIDGTRAGYSYAKEKWSLAELLGHFIDCQYLLMYRILTFARGEETDVPGAQEGLWVKNAKHGSQKWDVLLDVYCKVTQATIASLSLLDKAMLVRTGTANGVVLSAKEVVYYMIAHERHHIRVIQEKYL